MTGSEQSICFNCINLDHQLSYFNYGELFRHIVKRQDLQTKSRFLSIPLLDNSIISKALKKRFDFKSFSMAVYIDSNESQSSQAIIRLSGIRKTYSVPDGEIVALSDISIEIKSGELVAILGKSGSGKTSLMNLIAGIDRPTNGQLWVSDINLHTLSESKLATWRGRNIGVVFQFYQLLPSLTILENVMLPMDFCNTIPKKERKERAIAFLDLVGIRDQVNKLPALLSGGQQQRAAIARALVNNPPIIVADEPTGNLDSLTANSIFELFIKLSREGKTVVIITHEKDFVRYFKRTIVLSDGKIIS